MQYDNCILGCEMGRFIINGNKQLSGKVNIDGSKNAALPIIFSCITVKGISTLENVPDIGDVNIAIDILKGFGAIVRKSGNCIRIDTTELEYKTPDAKAVSLIRASSYLLGACLARFGVSEIQSFGGCNFDNRPIDMHIKALCALGARLEGEKLLCGSLTGCDIFFEKASVGATANALIAASSAKGKTRIFGYAREPHIIALADFLKSAGADISFGGDSITVVGDRLSDSHCVIIPDMIEAGSYLALSAIGDYPIVVEGIDRTHLDSFFLAVANLGAVVEMSENQAKISGRVEDWCEIATSPYPGFPTDLQPIFTPMLAVGKGGKITENVWLNRFSYLAELSKFGIRSSVKGSEATVFKSKITPASAAAPDLRGGAAMIICALVADGKSTILGSEIIKRGYSDIVNKLRSLGADIIEES